MIYSVNKQACSYTSAYIRLCSYVTCKYINQTRKAELSYQWNANHPNKVIKYKHT